MTPRRKETLRSTGGELGLRSEGIEPVITGLAAIGVTLVMKRAAGSMDLSSLVKARLRLAAAFVAQLVPLKSHAIRSWRRFLADIRDCPPKQSPTALLLALRRARELSRRLWKRLRLRL